MWRGFTEQLVLLSSVAIQSRWQRKGPTIVSLLQLALAVAVDVPPASRPQRDLDGAVAAVSLAVLYREKLGGAVAQGLAWRLLVDKATDLCKTRWQRACGLAVAISLAAWQHVNVDGTADALINMSFCAAGLLRWSSPMSFSMGESYVAGTLLGLCIIPLIHSEIENDATQAVLFLVSTGLFAVCAFLGIAWRRRRNQSRIQIFATYAIGGILVCAMFFVMTVRLRDSPILWLWEFLMAESPREKTGLLLYWIVAVPTGIAFISRWSSRLKSTTIARKLYHILAVLLFLPPLWAAGDAAAGLRLLLALSLGVALCGLLCVESFRLGRLGPIGRHVEAFYAKFLDVQSDDPRGLIVAHLYLLLSFGLPLWLFLNDNLLDNGVSARSSALTLGGLLTIGVGDTSAAIVGKTCGKRKWRVGGGRGRRTLEGTLAFMLASCCFFVVWCTLQGVSVWTEDMAKALLGLMFAAIMEGSTSFSDNLLLPLVYIALLLRGK